MEQHRVSKRLGGRRQDEQLGVGRELVEALGVALLDLAGHRLAVGKPEPAGELGGVPGPRQLEQRERVAVALGDDLARRPRHRAGRTRCPGAAPAHRCRRVRRSTSWGSPARTSSPIPVRAAHTSATRSASRRRPTNPRICAEAWSSHCASSTMQTSGCCLGDLGEQRQRGKSDEEPVGCGAWTQPEHGREHVALRNGKPRRGDPAWARRADGGRCRPTPSRTRRRQRSRRAIHRPGPTGRRAKRSCPRPPRRAGR